MTLLPDQLLGLPLRTWLQVILPVAYIGYWTGWIIYTRTSHPLAKIPGPFWPSVSRTWAMYHSGTGDLPKQHLALHAKYGRLVRVGPEEVICDDPKEIPKLYPLSKPLEKTPWYTAWRPQGIGSRPDMFTNTSEKDHAAYQRVLGGTYSLSNILKSEPELDNTSLLFIERLNEFAGKGEAFDFGTWLEMYCYDNVGIIWFGKPFGFLKNRHDYGNYIQAVHAALPFLHVLAAAPAYIRPVLMLCAVTVPRLLKAVVAVDGVRKTAIKETKEAEARSLEATSKRPDMVSAMLNIVREKGEKNNFGIKEIISESWTAVMAGSDSTSIALRSIFYYLMKNPECLAKLRAEIDTAYADGSLTTPVQYSQAVKLPYLGAVIKESLRIFSPFAVPMQRLAPAQGITLAGTHIPAGWRVGLSPVTVQRNKEVFGEDSDSFRPERWLNRTPEDLKVMMKSMMHFGCGTRTCTGQHVAMTEIRKVVPEVIRHFTFRMSHDREWTTHCAGFNTQTGVTCFLEKRQLADMP